MLPASKAAAEQLNAIKGFRRLPDFGIDLLPLQFHQVFCCQLACFCTCAVHAPAVHCLPHLLDKHGDPFKQGRVAQMVDKMPLVEQVLHAQPQLAMEPARLLQLAALLGVSSQQQVRPALGKS